MNEEITYYEPSCGNCAFWIHRGDNLGFCVRNPPLMTIDGQRPPPKTGGDQYCGEWKYSGKWMHEMRMLMDKFDGPAE